MLVKPTIQEVFALASKLGPPPLPSHEAEKFFFYYESNGWRVGKNPMKCWKSALSGWRVRWVQGQKERLGERMRRDQDSTVDRTIRDIERGKL